MEEDIRKKLREKYEEKALEDIAPIRDPLDNLMKGKKKLKDTIYKVKSEEEDL
ncbi:MAG: hypothetical protein GKB99_02195 [Methanocellales archaeon]|nr:hypothetical protein [Methanocellales archaeon]